MPSFTSYELLLACRQPDCPVCRLEQRSIERYLDNQFYENVNAAEFRDWLRASKGFCHEHAWLAVNLNLGDALGFALIYRDVIDTILKQLENGISSPPTRRWADLLNGIPEQISAMVRKTLNALTPQKRCPACHQRDEKVKILISSLIDELEQGEMSDALQASDGLCLPHLRLALKAVRDASSYEKLVSIHLKKLETLHGELAELIRKNDYRFNKEGFGPEGDSWRRAVGMIAGSNRKK